MVTTDKKLKYQQNLAGRKIAIVVLLSANWPKIQTKVVEVAAVIAGTQPGAYAEIPI